MKAEWRSCTEAPGAPCVTMTGTSMMPTWSAGSWAVAGPWLPQEVPRLVRAQDPLSWTMWPAEDLKPTCGTVPTLAGRSITVDTMKMQASSARVSCQDPFFLSRGDFLSRPKSLHLDFTSQRICLSCFVDICLVLH